jgi:D-alanyl-D-alanine carboxypeptidase
MNLTITLFIRLNTICNLQIQQEFPMPNIYSKDFQSKSNFKILSQQNKPINTRSKVFFGLAIITLVFSLVVFVNTLISFATFTTPTALTLETKLNSSITQKSDIIQLAQAFNKPEIKQIQSSSQTQSIISRVEESKPDPIIMNSVIKKEEIQKPITEIPNKIVLPVLSGSDFQSIYESNVYANVGPSIIPSITDNIDVDNYIRKLGEGRGYKLRPQAIESNLISVDGFLLQPEAANSWTKLKQVAANDGVSLVLTSGYRSIASQRSIFAADLAPEYQVVDILNGIVDGPLQGVLNRASIPGYSRHHTGYTIDVGCIGEGSVFGNTSCYRWMKKDNFAQARIAGYIPSYPEGASQQGPNPEEWEFVWVGQK